MSWTGLIWKNGIRNKRRTVLTILSVALALFVLSTLITLVNELDRSLDESNPLRLTTHHAVSFTNLLPLRYAAQIERVPGVAAVTPLTWFGGIYIDEAHTDFAQFACDARAALQVFTDIDIAPEQKQAFIQQRTGVIVGRIKAEKHQWKLGDRISLRGALFPVDLELTISGIFEGSVNDQSSIFFHHDYFEEAWEKAVGPRGRTGMYWIRVNSAESIPRIMKTIDEMFRNSDAPTKTETERAFELSFIGMLGNLKGVVATISAVILFALLLVMSNTIAMSVRERTSEIAILKSIGFRRSRIVVLLLSEGILLTLTGGFIGSLGARLFFRFSSVVDIATLTLNVFQRFEVTWGIVLFGLLVSAAVGVLSTAVPACLAAQRRVADGLRHVG